MIADGLNYIKGYRYQLFCEAKALLTPSCVVHVGAPAEKCREWNAARAEEAERWDGETLENLVFRYEEPNGMARWDSPLFTVPWVDSDGECVATWEAVWEAVCAGGVKVKANQATVLVSSSCPLWEGGGGGGREANVLVFWGVCRNQRRRVIIFTSWIRRRRKLFRWF